MVDVSTLDVSEQPVSGDVLLIAGNGKLWTHPITQGTTTVGRTAECDIVVDDRALSRQQLEITLGPPLAIRDLGSTNGTKIGGKTHRGGVPIAITVGESFHVGPYTFMVIARARGPSTGHGSGRDLLLVEDPSPEAATSLVRDLARSAVNVLVTGESGVGKDVLAHTLHVLSGRPGPLQRINCAALPEQLLESELFGHERGAFTGALQARTGLFEAAERGTIFLDEIGELPLGLQAKLLRVIETREIVRLGATRATTIDVRVVCATNRDLRREVADKRFRHDLYFRIDGVTLTIPPLRERSGRIAPLATTFARAAGVVGGLSPEVLHALTKHAWPGNVRELKAVIERAALLARGGPIKPRHIAPSELSPSDLAPVAPAPPSAPSITVADDLDDAQRVDRDRIVAALAQCNHNQTRAAALLGISRTNLVTKLRVYRIPRPRA